MPLRNYFGRRTGVPLVRDDITQSHDSSILKGSDDHFQPPAFERVDTVGSKASSILSIKTSRSQDTGEYKLSVVNDSGIYLPPSPTEEGNRSPWSRRFPSRSSCETQPSNGAIEPFSISRESFDSYRRSFDVSAKSPVITHHVPPRQSLDSARFPRLPRSSLPYRDGARPLETEPESDTGSFEDVGLGEPSPYLGAPSRRRGFFGMFSESHEVDPDGLAVSRFLPGRRRRGQSGQGAELGSMERPETSASHDEVQMMV